MSTRLTRAYRGFSLVETMITIGVLTVGVLGIAKMQLIGIRSKNFASDISTASLLAHDLAEQAQRWSYTDTRLTPRDTVTSTDDSKVAHLWDMKRWVVVDSTLKAEFGEQVNDANALTSNALGTYQGVPAPWTTCTQNSDCSSGTTCRTTNQGKFCLRTDGTGPSKFYRYWNVFGVDLAGTGTAQGKLVQVIVRWKEPVLSDDLRREWVGHPELETGMRQVTFSTYLSDPTAIWQ